MIRPPHSTIRGRSRALSAAGRTPAFITIVVSVVTACGGPTPTAAAPEVSTRAPSLSPSREPGVGGPEPQLVVLSVGPGATAILVHRRTGTVEIPPPPGEMQWLAADGTGRLVATLVDGAILRSQGRLPEDPAWASFTIPAPVPRIPLSFAVPTPAGTDIAALAAAYGSGSPASLVLAGQGTSTRVVDTGIEANGAAPAWLDASTIAVAGLGATGTAGVSIVSREDGRVTSGPAGIRAVAAGSGWVALVAADQRTVQVLHASAARWWQPSRSSPSIATLGAPAGDSPGTDTAFISPEPIGVVSAIAMDPGGRALALVWTDAELVPTLAIGYDRSEGWRPTARYPLPAATSRAAVTWLPPANGP